MQLVQKRPCLVLWQILETPLKHATSVRVCGELVDAAAERVDEPKAVRHHVFDDLLNDLIHSPLVSERRSRQRSKTLTWLPLASLTQRRTLGLSSCMNMACCSGPTYSIA